MDLIDRLRELQARIPKLKDQGLVKTEEGTKNALIMPFITALGYNVFDPLEVTPELVADVGTKKGEKVDYAILQNNKPVILFECKCCGTDLKHVHASQLYRYFSVTAARFGVLTDGVIYRFYSDLVAANKMDDAPFFVFDILNFDESDAEELKRFSKSMFDEDKIITTASELKYKNLMKDFLESQFGEQPSENFIRLIVHDSDAFTGRFTQNVINEFAPLVKEALRLFINDQIEKRLKSALNERPPAPAEAPAPEPAAPPDPNGQLIVTTQEEIDAYYAVKAIVREVIDVKRVAMRDFQSYCNILIDDNRLKLLCRLHFNTAQKYLGILNAAKQEERVPVNTVDDIYKYAERLQATAIQYVNQQATTG